MGVLLEKLQVWGWPQELENMMLASMLTGDRVLVISSPGAAKTMLSKKIAKALGLRFGSWDLNAVAFEDLVGILDINAMKDGQLKFMDTPGTIWDKDCVTFEEINRCKQDIQGKILEVLREGTVNGLETGIKWCSANINPLTSDGTNRLAAAVVDRFAFVIYAPDAMDMTPEDRTKIVVSKTKVDAPALPYWMQKAGQSPEDVIKVVDTTDYAAAGKTISDVLVQAAKNYKVTEESMPHLGRFLAMFSGLLEANMRHARDEKSPDAVRLSGRRMTFLYRNILAYLAVEQAMSSVTGVHRNDLRHSIQRVILASIPYGVNEEEPPHEHMRNIVNQAVRQSFTSLTETNDKEATLQFELFCSEDPIRRVQILLSGDIKNEEALNIGWQRITTMNSRAADLLAFTVVQLDAKVRAAGKEKGIIPINVLDLMQKRVKEYHVKPELPKLPGQILKFSKELNEIIEGATKEDPILGLALVEGVHEFLRIRGDGNWAALKGWLTSKNADYKSLIAQIGA